jgi:hypothetical protein
MTKKWNLLDLHYLQYATLENKTLMTRLKRLNQTPVKQNSMTFASTQPTVKTPNSCFNPLA